MKIILIFLSLFFSVGKSISQINKEHLNLGENAPKIVGVNQFNVKIDSDSILKSQKILLLFYRGNWCPYCKKHLASLQENLQKLTEKGIFVIVVTPEKVDKIQETTKKLKATYSIIHDVDNKIMKDYKVAFEVNEQTVTKYLGFTLKKIQDYNEANNNTLPVPATYLIDGNKKIAYVHYNPDYSERASFKEILSLL